MEKKSKTKNSKQMKNKMAKNEKLINSKGKKKWNARNQKNRMLNLWFFFSIGDLGRDDSQRKTKTDAVGFSPNMPTTIFYLFHLFQQHPISFNTFYVNICRLLRGLSLTTQIHGDFTLIDNKLCPQYRTIARNNKLCPTFSLPDKWKKLISGNILFRYGYTR